MGIRDALRSMRGGEKKAAAAADDIEAPEPTWFQPRYDGSYDATGTGSETTALRLRFLPGGKVFESGGATAAAGPEQQDPCLGEYTGAGRFNVQRRFQRIISYAVLDLETSVLDGPPGFLARRVDGADRSTSELHFFFRPDAS